MVVIIVGLLLLSSMLIVVVIGLVRIMTSKPYLDLLESFENSKFRVRKLENEMASINADFWFMYDATKNAMLNLRSLDKEAGLFDFDAYLKEERERRSIEDAKAYPKWVPPWKEETERREKKHDKK